ncbi:MAG: DUF4097 domain-containing protein [Silvanigrellaceae bacterium]|nr:DUF4097 domain-containing protein [Silvanigrellaceae bacterium]
MSHLFFRTTFAVYLFFWVCCYSKAKTFEYYDKGFQGTQREFKRELTQPVTLTVKNPYGDIQVEGVEGPELWVSMNSPGSSALLRVSPDFENDLTVEVVSRRFLQTPERSYFSRLISFLSIEPVSFDFFGRFFLPERLHGLLTAELYEEELNQVLCENQGVDQASSSSAVLVNPDSRVHLVIKVPKSMLQSLIITAGKDHSVSLKNIKSSHEVIVEGVGSEGSLSAERVNASLLSLVAQAQNVEVTDCTANALDVNTKGGSVTLERNSVTVLNVQTYSGAVRLHDHVGGCVNIFTVNGVIDITGRRLFQSMKTCMSGRPPFFPFFAGWW